MTKYSQLGDGIKNAVWDRALRDLGNSIRGLTKTAANLVLHRRANEIAEDPNLVDAAVRDYVADKSPRF